MDLPALIVTGVVTLIGSGVGTAIVNYWLAERRARRELRRAKLEELFLAVTEWVKAMVGRWINIHAVMIGMIDYNQALDQMIKVGDAGRETGRQGFDKVEMLISLYFPELKASHQALVESREQLNEICTKHKQAYKRGENDPRFATTLSTELRKFDDAENALKDHIARLMADVTKWKPKALGKVDKSRRP